MSPLVITLLIVAGIAILIAIGYINHLVENNKLEKARLRANLNDRLRRCGDVSETLPGQLMTPALKLLLSRLELQFSERLLPLDKQNAALRARLEELHGLVGKGESIPVRNPTQQILTEAKAKDVRFLLENLHGQITRAAQDGLLQANEAKHWIQEIRHLLVQLHVEFFGNLGQQYPPLLRGFRRQGTIPMHWIHRKKFPEVIHRWNRAEHDHPRGPIGIRLRGRLGKRLAGKQNAGTNYGASIEIKAHVISMPPIILHLQATGRGSCD